MSEIGKYSAILIKEKRYWVDLSVPISLSHTIRHGEENPNCFFAPHPEFKPYQSGDFIGSIEHGSPVNFYNIFLNPHGSSTHTECVGHIKTGYVLKDCLKEHIFLSYVLSVEYETVEDGDRIISDIERLNQIPDEVDALILRVTNLDKESLNFSGTNPIFVSKMLISEINRKGVQHLLVEIPSIDKEEDGGKLEGHREFWYGNGDVEKNKTITELVKIPEVVEDGLYVLNLQVLNIALDVSPSNPVIYQCKK